MNFSNNFTKPPDIRGQAIRALESIKKHPFVLSNPQVYVPVPPWVYDILKDDPEFKREFGTWRVRSK